MKKFRVAILALALALLFAFPVGAAAKLPPPLTSYAAMVKKYGKPVHVSTAVSKSRFVFKCYLWVAYNGYVSECFVTGRQATTPKTPTPKPPSKLPGA